jgi:hypothetical protein
MKKSIRKHPISPVVRAHKPEPAQDSLTLKPRKVGQWAEVGSRLKRIRYVLGYGDGQGKAFCQAYEINYNTWNAWETGQNLIVVPVACRVVDMLPGLSLDWIYRGRTDERFVLWKRLEAALDTPADLD